MLLQLLQALLQLTGRGGVLLGEIEEDFDVVDQTGMELGGLNRPFQPCPVLECLLGERLVLPEVRRRGDLFDPGQLCLLRLDVKETSAVRLPVV